LREEHQSDGRIRRWARIAEMGNRVLRIILLEDGETVHNAFFEGRVVSMTIEHAGIPLSTNSCGFAYSLDFHD
jgi:hypothetical protein